MINRAFMKIRKAFCITSLLLIICMSVLPAYASITESPGAVQLNANTQVKINGPVGTYPTDTVVRAEWVGNQYFLDVKGEGGNELHAILEFYFFMSSASMAADFYVVRIMSKTTPNPDDGNWHLDNQGVDDPNGPANKVHVNVTSGAIRWDWNVPWDYIQYDLDRVVTVTETYSVSASLEGALYAFSDGAAGLVKGTISTEYKVTNQYTVSLYKWEIQPYGGSTDFQWKLGLKTSNADRREAIGEYFLVITVDHGKTAVINTLEFEGHLWHVAYFLWIPYTDMVEHLWAYVKSIYINYYAGTQNDANKGTDAGNSFYSATTITPGSYYGKLYLSLDTADWYSFSVTSGQKIYVSMTPPSGVDFDLQLYDPNGYLKAGSYYGAGYTDSISYTADSTGYWRIRIYIYSGEGQYYFYVSVYWPSAGGGGGGGCPILYVYNGTEYVCEGLLDIHNPEGVDVVYKHTLVTMPERVNGTYLLRLVEHPQTISHIDQVKLYAILKDKTLVSLPLIQAWHSEYGNVLPQLLFSDDWRVDEYGANWNNGVSQSIDLKFAALNPNMPIIGFIFQIEGNNMFLKE